MGTQAPELVRFFSAEAAPQSSTLRPAQLQDYPVTVRARRGEIVGPHFAPEEGAAAVSCPWMAATRRPPHSLRGSLLFLRGCLLGESLPRPRPFLRRGAHTST